MNSRSIVFFILGILSSTAAPLFAQPAANFCDWSGPWASTAPMAQAREGATATRLNDGRVLVLGGIDASGNMVAPAEVYDPAGANPTAVGSLAEGRIGHVAVLLNNGRVLVAGGYQLIYGGSTWPIALRLASAEIFDPATNQFTPAAPMSVPRQAPAAAVLADGRVLVTGGYNWGLLATAEIFNPATNSFTPTGSMSVARYIHTATRLANGKVIVAGGDAVDGTTASTEIYDPATGGFTPGPAMHAARRFHTATVMSTGMLVVVGGENADGVLASTESYSGQNFFNQYVQLAAPRMKHTATLLPGGKLMLAGGANATGDLASVEITPNHSYGFEPFAAMPSARSGHAAALLRNGGVLFVGGRAGASRLSSAVAYDPKFGAVGPMNSTRNNHTATKLLTGDVLIAGGQTDTAGLPGTASADLYSPVSRSFSAVAPMSSPRHSHTATRLNDGRVLIVGGQTAFQGGHLATAEIYNPASHTFSPAGSMSSARANHTATLLPNGRVLITGGIVSGATGLASAELFDPATNAFVATGAMNNDRYNHSATLLPDGRVLIAGGRSAGVITYSAELYDPAGGAFALLGQTLRVNRLSHTATLMWNGQVLLAGGATGNNNPTRSAEVYDPAGGYFWQVGDMAQPRHFHAAVQSDLPGGKVLILGGSTQSSTGSTDAVEEYDPSTGAFTVVSGKLQFDRYRHTATLLDDTSILITGGRSSYSQWGASAELSKLTHCGPLVTSMSPNAGQWGTPVIIGGSQFGSDQGLSTVSFNGVTAPISSWSDTQISTSVPHGATTGPMVVTVNGRQSNSPAFSVGAPDLTIVGISAGPASPAPSVPVTITVTVRNAGDANVDAFRVDFYKHSTTPPPGWGDFGCDLSGLAAGATGTCVGSVTYAQQGTHSMWAVIDVPGAIAEANESNNVFGPQALVVQPARPDLIVSVLANPPATVLLGGQIALSDTTRNNGNGPAGASNTRYYLSLDTVKSANDSIMVVRSVAALAAGGTHTYNLNVTLSPSLALSNYYVIACADDASQVSESDETNNCRASSTQVQIVSPDLVVTAVSNPPAFVGVGGSFTMADTVRNQGSGAAGASQTRYLLSADTVKGSGDRVLTGSRAVGALAVNASSGGSATVIVPSGTPIGNYYILACADDTSQVPEANNNNNCSASATRLSVSGSDLINAGGTNPPASAIAGSSFVVNHHVVNQGVYAANSTSTTRYYLGGGLMHMPGDTLLTGSRLVPALAAGAADVASVTVGIPGTMLEGTYYLFACADDNKVVTETSESNNCWRSATSVTVSRIVIGIPK